VLRRALLVIALALAGQALPSLAAPATVVRPLITVLDLPAADSTIPVTTERLIGITWATGSATVTYRWHTRTWSAWTKADDDTAASPHATPGTAPLWRPAGADLVQIHVAAPRARLVRVFDGHAVRGLRSAYAQTGRQLLGMVHSRADWGADESIRRGRPSYAPRVEAVVVHHTADGNDYAPADVPALIRADYAYHVQTRGWADLGYNLLVDRYGGIWEGRAGGLGKATIGAHAEGFNTGTLGVAVIADLTQAAAGQPVEKALARVIGYAAMIWHFDPRATVTLTSGGSPRFPAGRAVALHRVFGHQETGSTACPGGLQARLPALRALAVVAMGPAPVIREVEVTGAPVHAPKPLVLSADVSRPVGWVVSIEDAHGTQVAISTGNGNTPTLSWNGLAGPLPALPGSYTWSVQVDDGFHDVVARTGTVEVGLPLVG
jgi:hypothetical protein